MERFCCTAILLSRVDYGESDRILTLLTREHGRLSAFARGARKSRRRFAGVLEPFSLMEASVRAASGSLLTLEDARLIDGFDGLRRDLDAMARASYACELARELAREKADAAGVFDLLLAFLSGTADAASLMGFELGAMGASGFRPSLDRCVLCGASDEGEVRFDPILGGRLCVRCARARGARISRETLGLLTAIQSGSIDTARGAPAWIRAEARETLTGYVVHLMGRRLKSYEFMRQIGLEA